MKSGDIVIIKTNEFKSNFNQVAKQCETVSINV